ncbi:MAG: MFS transporter, partial [Sciscionella sp.]|nr:MFS transporter [Sciscionella sp.]
MFADVGLSTGAISALFVIWSVTGLITEVPLGVIADRFSRRHVLIASGLLKAAGYALWIAAPGFAAFAGGFVLWGLAGSCASGAFEALLYDGLVAIGDAEAYPRLRGRATAARLLAALPTTAAATVLFAAGGYRLAGWVSVGCAVAAGAMAGLLPETPRART